MDKKQCAHCKQVLPFSEFRRNRTRLDGLQHFCKRCFDACRGRRTAPQVCPICKHSFVAAREKRTFCSATCASKGVDRKDSRNGNWKGGETTSQRGYVYVLSKEHPAALNGYVKRATLVLEKKMGRLLRAGEFAHHINKIKTDDRPENLELTTQSEHTRRHWQERFEGK